MNSSALSALSAGAEPAWPEDAIEVGRILDAWGVKGWFKVQTFASDPQALFSSKRWCAHFCVARQFSHCRRWRVLLG